MISYVDTCTSSSIPRGSTYEQVRVFVCVKQFTWNHDDKCNLQIKSWVWNRGRDYVSFKTICKICKLIFSHLLDLDYTVAINKLVYNPCSVYQCNDTFYDLM